MAFNPLRIALIGPESTGKTTLCIELSEYFKTSWVPEYAREYIGGLNRPYRIEDVIHCAEQQIQIEEQFLKKENDILFSDTELIVIKVWLLDRFGECPDWIERKIKENKYDLFLLTAPDIIFIEDPVRENPDRRDFFYEWYRAELEKNGFRYEIVRGAGKVRTEHAIDLIKKSLAEKGRSF